MPSPPFQKRAANNAPGPINRLFRSRASRAREFVQALESRLAEAPAVESISGPEVRELLKKFRLDKADVLPAEVELYGRVAEWVVSTSPNLSLADSFLPQLRSLLSLAENVWIPLHQGLAEKRIAEILRSSYDQGKLLKPARDQLASVLDAFELPQSAYPELVVSRLGLFLASVASEAVDDEMLTPEEEKRLGDLSDQLGIPLSSLSASLKQRLFEGKSDWSIRYGRLEALESEIRLTNGEVCVRREPVQEMVRKRVRVATAYSGPTLRIRLMKGLYWRTGVIAHQPISREAIVDGDSGTLHLTNRRILFVGQKKSVSVALGDIVDVDAYSDAIEIKRKSGTHCLYRFSSDAKSAKRFQIVLSRLLNDDETAFPKPVTLPQEYEALQSTTESLALMLQRIREGVPLQFGSAEGTSLNLDHCRAALHHANFDLIVAYLGLFREISDAKALLFLSLLDEVNSALAHVEGKPQPRPLAGRFQAGELSGDNVRRVVQQSAAKEDVDGDLEKCRRLLAAVLQGSTQSRGEGRAKRRSAIKAYVEALIGTLKYLSEEAGSPGHRMLEALNQIQATLLVDAFSS